MHAPPDDGTVAKVIHTPSACVVPPVLKLKRIWIPAS
jgi:hypothetical protein